MNVVLAPAVGETARFQRKRQVILDAAAALINERGLKGLALADVADVVGLSTTSVTYYFKRKEQLASACFDRALDLLETMIEQAGDAPDPAARVTRFVQLNFEIIADIRAGDQAQVARLSDMRALEEPTRGLLIARYEGLYRRARKFFDRTEHALATARTHVLLETMFWLPVLLDHYAPADHARVEQRIIEIYRDGLTQGAASAPMRLAIAPAEEEPAQLAFLKAATRLIGERGYHGASVERIASELNVTKGSFYHHLGAKDDLVLACFQRSLATIERTQDAGLASPGTKRDQLAAILAALLERQFSDDEPLLRTTALLALPPELRRQVVDRSDRVAQRFAGLIVDAISEGSMPPIDPFVAAQLLMPMINAASELRRWAGRCSIDEAVRLYASTLMDGLFA